MCLYVFVDMHHTLDGKRSTYSDYAQSQVLAAGIKKVNFIQCIMVL